MREVIALSDFLDVATGLNAVIAGQRLGVERMESVSAHYNGYRLGRDGTLHFSWSYGF